MFNLARILNLLSVSALSLFSGAFIFIALFVVKFWQSAAPEVFLDWMSNNFFRFPTLMVPLNMIALILTIAKNSFGYISTRLCQFWITTAFIYRPQTPIHAAKPFRRAQRSNTPSQRISCILYFSSPFYT
ncbi:hypothetical protein [Altericista sp. CCNU0014]|uniref:hypothetical protein n=1 Tax=Altericista sp. CCNU0014 TaxID=3082949 RepID=UPI00384CEACA